MLNNNLLIDTSFLIYRSYFAYPKLTINQEPVGAFYGFAKTIIGLLKEYQPKRLIFAVDSKEKTWRHKIFSDYKAGRPPMEDKMRQQIPIILDWCKMITPNYFVSPGYEADDILHTISDYFLGLNSSGEDDDLLIFSSDKDLYQMLIFPKVKFIKTKNGVGIDLFDYQDFQKQYQLDPLQWVDYKALVGDPSDSLKGVSGIGPKTATNILKNAGDLHKLFEFLGFENQDFELTKFEFNKNYFVDSKMQKVLDKIKNDEKQVRQTYKLAKLQTVPDLQISDQSWNIEPSLPLLEKNRFTSLIKSINKLKIKDLESESLF